MEGVQAAGAPGTPQRQAAWDDATKTAIQEGLARPGDYPAQAPDDDWITRKVNGARMLGGIAAAAAQKQEVATKAAQAAKDTAEAAKATGDKTLMDMKLNLMKGLGADSIDNAVNSLADPKQFPDANNAMKQAGRLAMASGDPEKVNAAISGLYEKMVIPNLASTVAADTAKKVVEQKALLPGEVEEKGLPTRSNPHRRAGAGGNPESAACERNGSDCRSPAARRSGPHSIGSG